MSDNLSREKFLRIAGAIGLGSVAMALLTACGMQPTPTQLAQQTALAPKLTPKDIIFNPEYKTEISRRVDYFIQQGHSDFNPKIVYSDELYGPDKRTYMAAVGMEVTIYPPAKQISRDTIFHELAHIDIVDFTLISNNDLRFYKLSYDETRLKSDKQVIIGFSLMLGAGNDLIKPTSMIEEGAADLIMEEMSKQYAKKNGTSTSLGSYGVSNYINYLNKISGISYEDFLRFHQNSQLIKYMQKIMNVYKKTEYSDAQLMIASTSLNTILAKMFNGETYKNEKDFWDAFINEYKINTQYGQLHDSQLTDRQSPPIPINYHPNYNEFCDSSHPIAQRLRDSNITHTI